MAWLYQQRGSKNWWLGYRLNGKLIRRSLETPDRSQAEKELQKIKSLLGAARVGNPLEELYRALTQQAARTPSLRSELDGWLAEARGANSGETFDTYSSIANDFAGWLNADASRPLLSEITSQHVREYLLDRVKRLSPSTCNLRLKVLRAFFSWCVRGAARRDNPALAVRPLKVPAEQRRSRRAFALDEVRRLFNVADGFWRFAIAAGFFTGQRLGDIVTASVGAFDLSAGVWRLRQRKTSRSVIVPLRPPLPDLVADQMRSLGRVDDASPLWPERAALYVKRGSGPLSNEFHGLLVRAGLAPARDYHRVPTGSGRTGKRRPSEISFHSLRHSFVSTVKAVGGSQAVAKELAGHGSSLLSDHYTSLPPDVLRRAIDALPSLNAEESG